MALVDNLYARAGNQAVDVNPPPSLTDTHLTKHGSDWLWTVFSIFAIFAVAHALIYTFTDAKVHRLKKIMFIVPLFTNFIMLFCYFTYAANLGYTSTRVEFHNFRTDRGLGVRQVFYVKYIGWFLAWPFALFAIEVASSTIAANNNNNNNNSNNNGGHETVNGLLSIISGLIVKTLATEVYVLGLLIGILIPSSYKWGYFTFAVVAQLFAIGLITFSMFSSLKSTNTSKVAIFVIFFQLLVWIVYPICWGVSEGGNKIQPDSEAVFYGILDLITFAVIPTILTWINAAGVDEDFFHKAMHFNLRRNSGKTMEETPRQSGDTAVHDPQDQGFDPTADRVVNSNAV